MKISEQDAPLRKVDEALSITSLFDGKGFNFDCVIGQLSGHHPKVVNKVSDRMYFILEGEGTISVDSNIYSVSKGDLITIKKNQVHGLDGFLKYLIVTGPPFNPQNEKIYEDDSNRK